MTDKIAVDQLLARHPHIREDELDRLATKSPNGAIRKGIGGNITREDIHFRNIEVKRPEWIGRGIDLPHECRRRRPVRQFQHGRHGRRHFEGCARR